MLRILVPTETFRKNREKKREIVPGDEGEVQESFEVNKEDRGRERKRAKEKQG
jgi:hypothetical protein